MLMTALTAGLPWFHWCWPRASWAGDSLSSRHGDLGAHQLSCSIFRPPALFWCFAANGRTALHDAEQGDELELVLPIDGELVFCFLTFKEDIDMRKSFHLSSALPFALRCPFLWLQWSTAGDSSHAHGHDHGDGMITATPHIPQAPSGALIERATNIAELIHDDDTTPLRSISSTARKSACLSTPGTAAQPAVGGSGAYSFLLR
jgi:hypothetical protein